MTSEELRNELPDPDDVEVIESAQERAYNAHRLMHGECPLLREALDV